MSVQGPIIVVSSTRQPAFTAALEGAGMFPIVDATWTEASRAVARLQPAAVLVAMSQASEGELSRLAKQISAIEPYLPLIAIDPRTALAENAIPFSQAGASWDRLGARLRAALRVRALHATVMRRRNDQAQAHPTVADSGPVCHATVLLIGRGAGYAALSVALGERIGIVGALSIEAAAKHLNTRDIDGIVLGEGFSARVVDAFLTVLGEDARFRNLPVMVTLDGVLPAYDLPNLEIICGDPARIVANASPLIRQHAFETHLSHAPFDRCGRFARSLDRAADKSCVRARFRHRCL